MNIKKADDIEKSKKPDGYSWANPTLAVVLGDFGRDATLRFCMTLSISERRRIQEQLTPGSPFYDEYRCITLSIVGDLPFVKGSHLAIYSSRNKLLDDRILVGFPNGINQDEIVPRMGVLALHSIWNAVSREVYRVQVLNPCNTLAPTSWALEERFATVDSILEMLNESGLDGGKREEYLVQQIVDQIELSFPTVPEAVIQTLEEQRRSALMPLGTIGIAETYRCALSRLGSTLHLVEPDPAEQKTVFDAIRASIAQDPRRREASRCKLEQLAQKAIEKHGKGLAVVEASTDLDYGVGIDSNTAYAETVVKAIYG
jgi:hypothetical protein